MVYTMSACFLQLKYQLFIYNLSQNQNGRRQVQNEVIEVLPNECYAAAAKGIVIETNES